MTNLDTTLGQLVEQATARAVAAALAEHAAQQDAEGRGELLVSVTEAARRLDVSRDTIYELISDGHLETVELGRGVKVTTDSMRRFVASRKVRSRQAAA